MSRRQKFLAAKLTVWASIVTAQVIVHFAR
jgi:hypothetical protein